MFCTYTYICVCVYIYTQHILCVCVYSLFDSKQHFKLCVSRVVRQEQTKGRCVAG